MSDLLGILDQLDEARAKATPGPWAQHGADPSYVIGDISDGGESYLDVSRTFAGDPADAALIVAAVNRLPELTAALRAVVELADEAEERIRQSTPPITAERLIAEGEAPTVTTGAIRAAITAALTPEATP